MKNIVEWSDEEETLQITAEECNEVAIEISKCFRFGLDTEFKGVSNKERLTKEVADLLCMIDLLAEKDLINSNKIDEYKKNKINQLKIYAPKVLNEELF